MNKFDVSRLPEQLIIEILDRASKEDLKVLADGDDLEKYDCAFRRVFGLADDE